MGNRLAPGSLGPGAVADAGSDGPRDRADQLQERLALPVLAAALASVPAVFLTLLEGTAAAVGGALNSLAGAVLVAESLVLLAVSDDRLGWLRRNRWLVLLTVAMIPAVLFAVGPVQLLRLLKIGGALRIVRVGRIVRAGRILRQRAGLDELWQRVVGFGVTLLVAGFAAMVLVDPTSQSHQLLARAVDRVGMGGVMLAGGLLAAATWVVASARPQGRARWRGSALLSGLLSRRKV